MIFARFIFVFLIFKYSFFAQDFTFKQAWDRLVEKSQSLKIKEQDLKIANFRQSIAKDLYWPNIDLASSYTHLNESLKFDLAKSFSLDNSLQTIAEGIAKGAWSGAYQEAILSGKTKAQAMQIAQESSKSIISSFSELKAGFFQNNFNVLDQDVFSAAITLTWPIFTGGKIDAAQIVAQGSIKEAKAILKMSKQKQFEDLANVYFGAVLAHEILKTSLETQNVYKKHYEHAKKLYSHGQIANVEKLKAKASYDKSKVDTNKAKRNYEILQIALKNILHVNEDIDLKSGFFIRKDLPKLNHFLEKTLNSYPSLDIIKAKKTQIDGLIQSKKANYYPQVFLFGTYSLYQSDSTLDDVLPKWAVGLGVKMPLISSKGRSGKLDIAYAKMLKTDYAFNQAKRDLSVLVEKTYKLANQAIEEYDGLESSISLGKENLRLRQKSFSQGMATSLDVIDAELFLQSVKLQRLSASYQFMMSLVKLLSISSENDKFSDYEMVKKNYE